MKILIAAFLIFQTLVAPSLAQDNPLTVPGMAEFGSPAPGTPEVSRNGLPGLPTGVPDIFDPEVRALFQPVGVANLGGNPDFPVLLVVNKTGEQPQAMLLALDARNGKDTWTLASDPVILIALFSDPTTIHGVYVDAGFATQGQPSGTYLPLNDSTSLTLPDLLKAVTAVAIQIYM